MKFICDHCKTKYSIADQKVAGKVLKIRCKSCGEIIIVKESHSVAEDGFDRDSGGSSEGFSEAAKIRGRAPSKPASSILQMMPAAPLAMVETSGGELEPEPTRLSSAPDFASFPFKPSQNPEDEWYLAVEGQQFGPMGFAELRSRVKRGEAGDEAFVWRDGFEDWLELHEIPELRPFLPRFPPPPPKGKTGLHEMVQVPSRTTRRPTGQIESHRSTLPPLVQPLPSSAPTSQLFPSVPLPSAQPIQQFKQSSPSLQMPQIQQPIHQPMVTPLPAPLDPRIGVPVLPSAPGLFSSPLPLPMTSPSSDGLQALVAQARVPDSGLFPFAAAPVLEAREVPPSLISVSSFPIAQQPAPIAPAPAAAPAQKTPFVMKIAAVAGIIAALSGIVLVVYFIFFATPPKTQVASVQPVAKTEPTAASKDKPQPAQQDAMVTSFEFEPIEVERTKAAATKTVKTKVAVKAPAETSPALTADQKRLMELYKKPAAAGGDIPKNVVAVKASSGGGEQITGDDIQKVMRTHRPELKACYERALKRDNSLANLKTEVMVSIGGSGLVTSLKLKAGIDNPDFTGCLQRTIKRWVFPATGSTIQFSFPIIFKGS